MMTANRNILHMHHPTMQVILNSLCPLILIPLRDAGDMALRVIGIVIGVVIEYHPDTISLL